MIASNICGFTFSWTIIFVIIERGSLTQLKKFKSVLILVDVYDDLFKFGSAIVFGKSLNLIWW